MRASSSRPVIAAAERPSRFNRRPACGSRPSADLAGRSVRLSIDVPVAFDAPLAPHHKLIGGWAAAREKTARRYTRHEARARIERVFETAVLDILNPVQLADLRVVVLQGEDEQPTAIAVVCDSVGPIDLGWIEKDNVLSNTLFSQVAPVGWQAAAYKALCETLASVLPVFDYDRLFDEIAAMYWDSDTTDLGAIKAMVEWHGMDIGDVDEEMLPSAINARRPGWMLADNAAPLKDLPPALADRIRRLRAAHKAVTSIEPDAWHFDFAGICEYVADYEDCSTLPPMTLVPFEHFERELDDVGRHGMETRFMDISGLCPLPDPGKVEGWFASLRLGAELLLAAQELINFDPVKLARG